MSLIEIYFRLNRDRRFTLFLRAFFGKTQVFRYDGSRFLRDFFGNASGFRYDSTWVSSGIVRERPKKHRVFPEKRPKPLRTAPEALLKRTRRNSEAKPAKTRSDPGPGSSRRFIGSSALIRRAGMAQKNIFMSLIEDS